ncbi:hypothetical protein HPB52_009639 [Rhipicephalus sanguineus]|uniref:Uncharacterized protein n=1 Tax=Rhipicephalus sanguineus TaxID=34632 RepID=A0A9D4PIC4_RHISA|nr:hypothetical protein HPB52_009639 [Rhipicephalus sanguineus]
MAQPRSARMYDINSAVPSNLRKQVLANFLSRADYYVQEACELLHLNDQTLWDVIGDRPVKMEPRHLLSRLKDLLTKVLKMASILDFQDFAEPK